MYLIQEWIYRPGEKVERIEETFDNLQDAEHCFDNYANHLQETLKKETLNYSFVRLFKMKPSTIAKEGFGVEKCLKYVDTICK